MKPLKFEQIIEGIYARRTFRPIYGTDGMLERVLGRDEDGGRYFDQRRNSYVQSERAEFYEALEMYDTDPSPERLVSLLSEAGDLVFQVNVLRVNYPEEYSGAIGEAFGRIIIEVFNVLKSRGIRSGLVTKVAKAKYAIRMELQGKDSAAEASAIESVIGARES